MYKNVTLNTRKIDISIACPAADDAIIMTWAFHVKIHNNGLPGKSEIHLADMFTLWAPSNFTM